GWSCVLVARRRERLERLAAELGGEFAVCDVADRRQVEEVAARHPEVKLLVCNAGIPGRGRVLEQDEETIRRVLDVDYLGNVWTLRAFLPALERAAPSHVVNVVSVAGTVSLPPASAYVAAKHAQLAFSRAVAAELRPRGVRVHTVNPGFVDTEGFPNRERFGAFGRFVIGPQRVAEHVLRTLERGRAETYVPGWYRAGAVVEGLAPGLLARLLARGRSRKM
ncbi:MAG: SDR family oxidoreductase, partial [Actinomycetota bacterium]|nr:SDR family oxidoreductase [Actinomycetota bacterium]